MKNVIGISHIAINVKSMEDTIAFYCENLGFEKAFELPHPEKGTPWVVYLYAEQGQFLELFYGGENEIPYEKNNMGFSHICILSDNLEKLLENLKGKGIIPDREITLGPDGNYQCWIHDPNGVRIELMEFKKDSLQSKFLMRIGEIDE